MKSLKFLFLSLVLIATSCNNEENITNTQSISNEKLSAQLKSMYLKTEKINSSKKLNDTFQSSKKPQKINQKTSLVFDTQDNLVQINGGSYEQNWDLDNNKPKNKKFALQTLKNRVVLYSETYSFKNVIPTNLKDANYKVKYSYDRKTVVIYCNVSLQLYNTDYFNFQVETINPITTNCNYLDVYAIDTDLSFSSMFFDFPRELYIIVENHNTGKKQFFEYVNQGYSIGINPSEAYTFTIAKTEDLFVRDVIDIDANINPWCFVLGRLKHTE